MDQLALPRTTDHRLRTNIEVLLIFAVFFAHACWPVPDVNEGHYLAKAKHHWDPSFCATDFFLNSSDAHVVFHWSFGWLSKVLSLDAMAWAGRLLTWGLTAWAWRRLSVALLPVPWFAVLSASLFVFLNETMHMAGEWVVGGVEAKGFSYVLVFLALEALVRGRWNRVWLLIGAASAVHVLVGGWAAVAAGVVWLVSSGDRPALKSMWPALLGGLMLAAVGLWPAIALTSGAPAELVRQANEIYVFERLPHHLYPPGMKLGFVWRHLALWCIWLVLCRVTPVDPEQRRLRWFVSAAMLIAAAGLLISSIGIIVDLLGALNVLTDASLADLQAGARRLQASVLRYYWFRPSDALVPLGIALVGLTFVRWICSTRATAGLLCLTTLVIISGCYLGERFRTAAFAEAPRLDKNVVHGDWTDVCRWARDQSPADAVFLTPRLANTFHWYAARSEVANWKDVPQDSAGIVEWRTRIRAIYERPPGNPGGRWYDSLADLGPQRLAELGRTYDAQYAIVTKSPLTTPLPWRPEYENQTYGVYRLPKPPVTGD